MNDRPDKITDEMLYFLDDLRESGVTNMFGAGEYLRPAFGFDENQANTVLSYWMETFGNEDR